MGIGPVAIVSLLVASGVTQRERQREGESERERGSERAEEREGGRDGERDSARTPFANRGCFFSHFQAGGRRFRTKSHWELPSHIPNLVHLGGIGPVAIVTPRRIMATLEATQGQISSESPTDATSGRYHLDGS